MRDAAGDLQLSVRLGGLSLGGRMLAADCVLVASLTRPTKSRTFAKFGKLELAILIIVKMQWPATAEQIFGMVGADVFAIAPIH